MNSAELPGVSSLSLQNFSSSSDSLASSSKNVLSISDYSKCENRLEIVEDVILVYERRLNTY